MKKSNFLKAVLSVVFAMLVTSGVFGQVQGGIDYLPIAGATVYAAGVPIDSVTTGTTTRLYTKPDAYYHPNYTAGGGWALTGGFTWTWTVPAITGTQTAGANSNVWAEIQWGAANAAPVKVVVTETTPAGFGGCSGDTNVWVRIVPEPTATFTADNPGSFIGANLTVCEGDARLTDIVQSTLTGFITLQLDWSLEIATLNTLGAKVEYWDLAKATLGGAQAYAIERDGAGGNQEVDISALTFDFDRPNDGDYTAVDDGTSKKPTLYTYAINGVNDRISRKSDYLTNSAAAANSWSWYDTTAETIIIRVNPAPVTGPIYHIPNTWNY